MPVHWKPSRVESLLHRPLSESLLNEQAFVVSAVANLDFDSIEPNGVRLKLEYGSSLTTLEKVIAEMLRLFCVLRLFESRMLRFGNRLCYSRYERRNALRQISFHQLVNENVRDTQLAISRSWGWRIRSTEFKRRHSRKRRRSTVGDLSVRNATLRESGAFRFWNREVLVESIEKRYFY